MPMLHQIGPIESEAAPAAAFAMVMLLAGPAEEGNSAGYRPTAAPTSVATMCTRKAKRVIDRRNLV